MLHRTCSSDNYLIESYSLIHQNQTLSIDVTMADYNIIYTSADDKTYLWNGNNFDLLHNEDNAGLMHSGKTYEDKELPVAIKKAKQVVKKTFPDDRSPQVEKVEVPVNSKDETQGHSKHITS